MDIHKIKKDLQLHAADLFLMGASELCKSGIISPPAQSG